MAMDITQSILSDITVWAKYAKWTPETGKRETWEDLCERNMAMHIRKYPQLKAEIKKVYKDFVYTKKVLPSMRSLQFGGRPIELSNNRIFNCSYLTIDHSDAFSETMFLLLGGSGVGISVQKRHVSKLPIVQGPKEKQRRFLVGDSIEGWADTVKVLVEAYFKGKSDPVFDYRDIRPKGARLITSGGKAPGPEPLRVCIDKLRGVLDYAKGRQLTPLEAHDMICHISDAVLSGGIRRAALISLFDIDDMDMMTCKGQTYVDNWELEAQVKNGVTNYHGFCIYKGKRHDVVLSEWDYKTLTETQHLPWYFFEQQRGRANNSVVLDRKEITKEQFFNLWQKVIDSRAGEPGVYWTNNKDWGTNPCCFTGDTMVAVADGRNQCSIEDLAKESNGVVSFPVYSAKFTKKKHWKTEIKNAVAFMTGVKPVVLVTLSNGDQIKCTDDHLFAKPNGSYIMAKDSLGVEVETFFTVKNKYRTINSFTNGYARQHRLIWEFNNGLKPEGYDIDHVLNNDDDSISNLQMITTAEHLEKSSNERKGLNNPIFRLKDREKFCHNLSCASSGPNNSKFSGLFDIDLINIGKKCVELGQDLTVTNCRAINNKFPLYFSKNRFGGSFKVFKDIVNGITEYIEPKLPEKIEYEKADYTHLTEKVYVSSIEFLGEEKVYDLTVEDNHNFYIITKSYDEKCIESRGILVHNCEIGLKPNQFCNLTEINASDCLTQDELNARSRAAAFIGTLQVGFTDFHYLRSCWKDATEEEALLGVSMTGIASGAVLKLDLREAARETMTENERVAKLIGVKPAARITAVKPAGTTSLVCGSSSGIHAWHNDYYIRRMRVGKNEALYSYMTENIPDLIEDCKMKPTLEAVMSFPQKAPDGAILRTENFKDLLERVRKFNIEWVSEGHREGDNHHNVSCTISLKENEWWECAEWMWENRNDYNGISVLPYDGGTYVQAPFEDITKEQFDEMVKHLHAIDLSKVIETDDNTAAKEQAACAGGACEVQ